jgi:CBS domain-containing protein
VKAVKDILKAKGGEIFSVRPEATLFEALEAMADRNIGSVLVIDKAGEVAGIFTERDFVRKFMVKGRTGEGTKVEEIMTRRVLYVGPETSISDCMNLMTEKRVRHLPVLENGKPVGVVSIGDIVKAILTEQELLITQQASEIGQLERYISGAI